MIWMDFNIEQAGDNFRVKGDWPGEVMGKNSDGTDKDYALYRPGDVFVVGEDGWLRKVDDLTSMILMHENNKKKQSQQHDPKP